MNELFNGDVRSLQTLIDHISLVELGSTDGWRLFASSRSEFASMLDAAKRVLAWLWSDEEEGSYDLDAGNHWTGSHRDW